MGQEFIPTGSTLLDLSLGGGWAQGRVINLVGDSSSGKSLLAIEAAANFSRKYPEGQIRYVETEAAFDSEYAESVGFPERGGGADVGLIDAHSDEPIATIEEFFVFLDKFVKAAKVPGLIILDSFDALSDEDEMERAATDTATYGMHKAKAVSTQLRKHVQGLKAKNITLIIVSQVRDAIGVTFGKQKTRSGGKALRFYSSQEVWISYISKLMRTIKKASRTYGIKISVQAEKNRHAPSFRPVSLEIHFNYGVEDLLSCARFLDENGFETNEHKRMKKLLTGNEIEKYEAEAPMLIERTKEAWDEIEERFRPSKRKYERAENEADQD